MSFHNDDGGEGRYRGGKGVRIKYRLRSSAWFSAAYSGSKIPPWSLEGGNNGSNNRIEIIKAKTGETQTYSVVTNLLLDEGDIICLITATGGGYGKPEERDPEKVSRDLKNEFITREQAEKFYNYKGQGNPLLWQPNNPSGSNPPINAPSSLTPGAHGR